MNKNLQLSYLNLESLHTKEVFDCLILSNFESKMNEIRTECGLQAVDNYIELNQIFELENLLACL